MSPQLEKKVGQAIKLLQMFDNPKEPVQVSYSGGKDSDVILQLVRESGINYRAIYKNTTIDPPGTIKHVKDMGVEILNPKLSFFQLVEIAGYPNRRRRYCCARLKEYKVLDKVVIGVRKAESNKRMERYQEPTECRIYNKNERAELIYPILTWSNDDVAEFLADRKIKCHPLYYDENDQFHVERRLGCLGCPIASKANRLKQFKKYPKLVRCYIRAGRKYMEKHPNSSIVSKYGDVYSYFYRNLFCDSEEEYNLILRGLFGKPNFKEEMERYFQVELP